MEGGAVLADRWGEVRTGVDGVADADCVRAMMQEIAASSHLVDDFEGRCGRREVSFMHYGASTPWKVDASLLTLLVGKWINGNPPRHM